MVLVANFIFGIFLHCDNLLMIAHNQWCVKGEASEAPLEVLRL